ncbi:MAG TPA: winged helix-turn-helix domain-containing protein [Cellvibrio sp.]|nr:winged helix-turn-helix domain-containing protein [Cellvibrio sp.]
MKYAFNDFVFDSEQLLLYKNNELVAFRHNESKLLALLLREPSRIFSKDEILEQVWAGKVVSEQAIFQNISLLRTLFGESAIKTFSKKGYQWQLATREFTEPAVELDAAAATTASGFRNRWMFVALTLMLLSVGSFLYWRLTPIDVPLPRIALLPISVEPANRADQNVDAELVQPLWRDLSHTKIFSPAVISGRQDYQDFFHAPQKYFRQLAQQTQSDLLLGAVVGAHSNTVSVRYALKSEHGFWEATHQAATVAALLEKMNAHIALVLQSKILDVNFSDATLINARLKILHQQAPDDLVVLAQLATSEYQNASANNAVLLAGELSEKARLQDDTSAEAEGHLIAANAYITQSRYADADTALQKASALYAANQNYRALNKVQQGYANLAFAKQDYSLFKQALLAAMQFAQQAQDPLLEFRNSAYLSVVANKFGEKLDRQTYLDHAEVILDQTGQSKELYGLVYFYAGMFAESPALAEKHYRKVLAMLPADQDWWERERAQVHLTELLLSQSRWQEALDLFPTTQPLKASEELMVTKIYAGQKNWDQAEAHGLNTFKAANLTGQHFLGLDTALVLVDIYQTTNQPEKAQIYKNFIFKEAANVPYWIKFNRLGLEKLAIAITH